MTMNRQIEEEGNLGIATATTKPTATKSTAEPAIKPAKAPRNVRKDGDAKYYRELLLSEFGDVLVDKLPNELPPLRKVNHRIPYKPKKPFIARKYRLPEAHKQALERDV